jgi:hypothetical protein
VRIFFDFEFIEEGAAFVMEPISLGMIREDGESLYIEFEDVDWSKANQWVLDNVKPYLKSHPGNPAVSKEEARKLIREFVGPKPEFWAYFADYDWVILCQLFGRMIDIPEGWPYYCLDIKQLMWEYRLSKDDLNIDNEQEHNALADAHWNMRAYDKIREIT